MIERKVEGDKRSVQEREFKEKTERERKGGYKYIKIRGKERMGDEGKLKRR